MLHTFTHEAMTTTFQVVIASDDARYARQAAAEAFAELGRIEARLSRFAEASDIFRINRLRAGEAAFVHHDTIECLRLAEQVRRDTAGAFDIAYLGERDQEPFSLDEASHTVRVLAEGVRLDLGGIGKGFALDRMGEVLREWEIASALLAASTSTLLALDPPPGEEGWAAQLGPDNAPQRLALASQALSASGLAVKGSHIIDPRTGRPAEGRFRAWALAPTAALADALSTAFMAMSDEETLDYCRRNPDINAHLLPAPSAAVLSYPPEGMETSAREA
ncbi:MAG TPA: FAD:protein FMN transferase [Planctomycetota bacterium]|nr:FAD:protein FMN transferase [Planctomycetota bacterium]